MKQRIEKLLKGLLCMTLIMTMSLSSLFSHLGSVFAEEEGTLVAKNIDSMLSNPLTNLTDDVATDVKLVDENKDKREQNVKHFIREDGLVEATYYAHSVHYEKDGKWEDIDNSLEAITENGVTTYKNKSNSFEINFAETVGNGSLVSMANSGSEISWSIPEMEDAEITVENGGSYDEDDIRYNNNWFSKVTYSNGLNGMDVTYIITPDGVKEYFIVENEMDLEKLEDITIVLEADNLTVSEDDGRVFMKNAEGKEKFRMEQPIMFDASGEEKEGLSLEVKEIQPKSEVVSPEPVIETEVLQEDIVSEAVEGSEVALASDEQVELQDDIQSNNAISEESLEEGSVEETEVSKTELYIESISEEITETTEENYYTYTLSVDKENLSEIEYPLVIDPDITTNTAHDYIFDAFVCLGTGYYQPDIKYCDYPFGYNKELLKVGYGAYSGELYSYIKINQLDHLELDSDDMIVNATLRLTRYASDNYEQASGDELNLHEVTGPWEEGTITGNSQPTWNSRIESVSITKDPTNDKTYGGFNNFDVTRLFKKWHEDESTNYGVMIKSNKAGHNYYEFVSGELANEDYQSCHPTINVVYINTKGLEDNYSYHEQAVGRAGVGYVADHTGNLTFIHDDTSTNGGALSISLKHVFDNVNKDTNSGYGKGWKLNYDETIKKEKIGTTDYYVYSDSDGTLHYYSFDSYDADAKTYHDETNKKNVLSVSSGNTEITLTNLGNNISKVFSFNGTSGYLKEIRDNNNNKIVIARTNNKITSLTDSNGYNINLIYDVNGYLTNVRNDYSTILTYTYTNGLLTQIQYADGKVSKYTYTTNGEFESAEEINGYKVAYTYSGTPKRVSSVTEYDNGTSRSYLNFTYGRQVTTVEDRDGDINHYRFNIYGQVVNIQDKYGNSKSYDYKGSEIENRNKLSASSDITASYVNMIDDSSFEHGKLNDIWALNDFTSGSASFYSSNRSTYGDKQLVFKKTSTSDSALLYTEIIPEAGKTYNFSCDIRGSAKASLYMSYYDTTGEVVAKKRTIQSKMVGWVRNNMIIDVGSDYGSDLKVGILFEKGSSGSLYIDNTQLIEGTAAGEYNILMNSDFSDGANYWTASNCVSSVDKVEAVSINNNYKPENLDNKVYKMVGDISKSKTISQTTTEHGSAGDMYVFGGFVKAESVMPFDHVTSSGTTKYGRTYLKVDFMNNGTLVNSVEKDFMCESFDWQYLSFTAQAAGDFTNIVVSACYMKNRNTAYFDGFHLYSQGQGSSYEYDESDNLTEVVDKDGESCLFTYNADHTLATSTDPYNVTTEYTYDANKNLLTSTSQNMVSKSEYDSYGNIIASKYYHTSTPDSYYYYSASQYSSTRKHQKVKDIDARGNSVLYTYNGLGFVESVENDKDKIEYVYDSMNRMSSVESIGTGAYTTYSYANDNLAGILLFSGNSFRFGYNLSHNTYGQLTQTKVGTRVLSTNEYDPYTRLLSKVTYGNGYERQYSYDDKDRLVGESDSNGTIYKNYYGDDGKLYESFDNKTQRRDYYNYDEKDRVKSVLSMDESNSSSDSYGDTSVVYNYNSKDLVSSYSNKIGSNSWGATYTYDDYNRLIETTVDNGTTTVQITRDNLGRPSSKDIGDNVTLEYEYLNGSNGKTTDLVSWFYAGAVDSSTFGTRYTYDSTGLLTKEISSYVNKEYTYDAMSQLTQIRDNSRGFTYYFTYDEGGNIINRTVRQDEQEGVTPVEYEFEYVYDNTWKDLLVKFNGQTIEYDAIGNPTKYLGYSALSWEGRSLKKIMNGTNTVAEYAYDADGIRTKKTVGDSVTEYIYIGGQLSALNTDEGMLYFTYDGNGDLVSVNYDGTDYYYITNPFGDVIALINAEGNVIERYIYDEYGTPSSYYNTEIGHLNPFRYKGYIYDEETGFYYLMSRYYDPVTGRFVNADQQLNLDLGILGCNLFAYCSNNPIMKKDISGNREISALSVESETPEEKDQSFTKAKNDAIERSTTANTQKKEYAATVYAEAGGQNDISKAAVANVINNRVGTKESWNDVADVISCGEFVGYESDMYYEAMNYYNTGYYDNIIEKEAMDTCMQIVVPIFNGVAPDITGGALYFHSLPLPEDWKHHYHYTQVYIEGTEGFWFYK